MGGSWQQKKTVVEDCVELDVKMLVRRGSISPNNHMRGTIDWTNETGSSQIEFECKQARGFRLRYGFGSRVFDYTIPLTTTETRPFGGQQYWFRCPATWSCDFDFENPQEKICGRRVGKLYLPPGSTTFGCRHCYHLTYRSSQTSHCTGSLPPAWLSSVSW
jgi:hypothetical protein